MCIEWIKSWYLWFHNAWHTNYLEGKKGGITCSELCTMKVWGLYGKPNNPAWLDKRETAVWYAKKTG